MRKRFEAWCSGTALELAVLRITVGVVVLGSVDVWDARSWGGDVVCALVLVSTAAVTVGLFTRAASCISALGLWWLLGLPQASGQVMHTHHLLWFMCVVASGPSGDAWSIDAWRKRVVVTEPSVAYGLPLRVMAVLVGCIFFFPGCWKLAHATTWLEGLPALVAWKRFQFGMPPTSLSPSMLRAGGAFALAFELLVPALLSFRRTRLLAVGLALAFHAGVQLVMGIGFSSLWACYVVFGPWSPRGEVVTARWREAWPTMLLVALLLPAVAVMGALGREDGWPVASYPRFVEPAPTTVLFVEFEGGPTPLTLDALRRASSQRWWGLASRAAMNPTPEVLRQLHEQWAHAPPSEATRFFVTNCEVERGGVCQRRELAATTGVPSSSR